MTVHFEDPYWARRDRIRARRRAAMRAACTVLLLIGAAGAGALLGWTAPDWQVPAPERPVSP